jgi:hypothetical protein
VRSTYPKAEENLWEFDNVLVAYGELSGYRDRAWEGEGMGKDSEKIEKNERPSTRRQG